MKKNLLLIILLAFCITGFSQTKKIAHRSHSGKNATLIMNDDDNFGLPPTIKDTAKKVPLKKDTAVVQNVVTINKKSGRHTSKKKARK